MAKPLQSYADKLFDRARAAIPSNLVGAVRVEVVPNYVNDGLVIRIMRHGRPPFEALIIRRAEIEDNDFGKVDDRIKQAFEDFNAPPAPAAAVPSQEDMIGGIGPRHRQGGTVIVPPAPVHYGGPLVVGLKL